MKNILLRKNKKGLTLIEILVVIAIIGVLMTIGAVAVRYAKTKAMIAKAQHDLDQIYKAITTLSYDTNLWSGEQTPDQIGSGSSNEICGDGCAFGLASDNSGIAGTNGNYSNWSGPYMESVPIDAWNNEYFFDTDYNVKIADGSPCDGGVVGVDCITVAAVGSYGPNGTGNNSYDDDDIIRIIAR